MLVKPIEIDYAPRRQFRAYHNRTQRWACLICHRRAGKTVASLNDIIRRAIIEKKPEGRYAFIFPYRGQAKDTAWRYLKRYAGPLLASEPRESDLSVDLVTGQMIRLYGADNPDSLRGPYLDGAVFDEFGDMYPDVWFEVVRPMLADRRGWASFIGTVKGVNAFWKLYAGDSATNWPGATNLPKEWFAMMLKASESGILPASELDEMRRTMGPDRYLQEMECDPNVAIKGAFYADEMRVMDAERRIRPLEIVKDVRVHTGWDIGRTDATAIIFVQCIGGERRIVDYYEMTGKILTHYAEVLHEKKREHGWKYGTHFWPPDMYVTMIDAEKSREAMMHEAGVSGDEPVPQHDVLEGINVVRKMLGRTYIDPIRCERLIDALRQYRREWNDKTQTFKPTEFKDWTNNPVDAVRTFAVGFDDPQGVTPPNRRRRESNEPRATSWAA